MAIPFKGYAIFIPTYGRVDRQVTWKTLPRSLRSITYLVAVKEEENELREVLWAQAEGFKDEELNIIVQPKSIKQIHTKRQFIMEEARRMGVERLVMFDDDIKFQRMGEDGKVSTVAATEDFVTGHLSDLNDILKEYAHAGFVPRQGSNRYEQDYKRTGRMMFSLGYHVGAFFEAGARFDRVHGKEDFDVTLQLLRKGYDNVLITRCIADPGAYGKSGGCTDERTVKSSDAAADLLAHYHPGFVSVVQREYKAIPRKEVVMKWKKAFEDGMLGLHTKTGRGTLRNGPWEKKLEEMGA